MRVQRDATSPQLGSSQPETSLARSEATSEDSPTTRPGLHRATTDIGRSTLSRAPSTKAKDEDQWVIRHGWAEQYNSEEYLNALTSVRVVILSIPMMLTVSRPSTCILRTSDMKPAANQREDSNWTKDGSEAGAFRAE